MKTVLKAFLAVLALATLSACASYRDRLSASEGSSTAGASTSAAPPSAPLDRFFAEEDRASRYGR